MKNKIFIFLIYTFSTLLELENGEFLGEMLALSFFEFLNENLRELDALNSKFSVSKYICSLSYKHFP